MSDTAMTDPVGQPPVEPKGQEPKKQEPARINLDAQIEADGEKLTVQQILEERKAAKEAAKEVEKLQQFKAHTAKLLQGEGVDAGAREESIRYVLTENGYSPEEVEAYVQATMGEGGKEPEGEKISERDIQYALRELQEQKLESLKRTLNEESQRVLDKDPNMKLLLDKVKDLRGEEGFEEAINTIRGDLQADIVNRLKVRTAASGHSVKQSWVGEEADNAAKAVHKKLLSVIGDPNKIQRAPETATGEDYFKSRKPVAPPSFQRGDNMGTATVKAREWSLDTLSRLAVQTPGKGQSKA